MHQSPSIWFDLGQLLQQLVFTKVLQNQYLLLVMLQMLVVRLLVIFKMMVLTKCMK